MDSSQQLVSFHFVDYCLICHNMQHLYHSSFPLPLQHPSSQQPFRSIYSSSFSFIYRSLALPSHLTALTFFPILAALYLYSYFFIPPRAPHPTCHTYAHLANYVRPHPKPSSHPTGVVGRHTNLSSSQAHHHIDLIGPKHIN